MLSPNLGQLEGKKADAPLPHILEDLSAITGTPTGVVVSSSQESISPKTDWMDQLRIKGLNPQLRLAWGHYKRAANTNLTFLQKQGSAILENAVFNHGKRVHEKVAAEYTRRGVADADPAGYFNINLDANILLEVLADETGGGAAFVNGLCQIHGLGVDSGINAKFFINQFAGLSAADSANNDLAAQRFERIKQSLPNEFNVQAVNAGDVDYRKMIDTVKEFGGHDFRCSLELGRIFPEDGHFNEEEYGKLRDWILYCREVEISPNLCLQHFTFPGWFKGGWSNQENVNNYVNYSTLVLQMLKADNAQPDRILTMNEPQVQIGGGEVDGGWPPFHKTNLIAVGVWTLLRDKLNMQKASPGVSGYAAAIENSVQAHTEMYTVIKKLFPDIPVGFTYNLPLLEAINNNPANKLIINLVREGNNTWFKSLISKAIKAGKFPADFVGLQFYNAFEIGLLKRTLNNDAYAMDLPLTESRLTNGWKRCPEGMIIQMLHVSRWLMDTAMEIGTAEIPQLGISETGVSSNVDQTNSRGEYHVLAEAINLGKNLIPNEVPFTWFWTLFGNREWSSGYPPDFGMLQIDGSGKPRTSIPPQELNLNSPSLIIELGKHVRALERFQEHLIRLQTSQQQLDIVENRLENTRNLKRNSKKKYVEV